MSDDTIPHFSLSSSPESEFTLIPSSPTPSVYSLSESGSDGGSSTSSLPCDETCCAPVPARDGLKAAPTVEAENFVPVMIIGAGPHGLGLASRLAESHPDGLYSDLEHARLSWLQRHGPSSSKRVPINGNSWSRRKILPTEAAPTSALPSIARRRMVRVLDSTSNKWLGRWDSFFRGLEITHLRSPMFFHPAPDSIDAMVAYSVRQGRESELKEITGVVGAEKSKHWKKKFGKHFIPRTKVINERERQDYFRPSAGMFRDFIEEDLVQRYELEEMVSQTTVTRVSYGPLHVAGEEVLEKAFYIESINPDGSVTKHGAKAVALAVGPSSAPNVPPIIRGALASSSDPNALHGEGWCHSTAFAQSNFRFMQDPHMSRKLRRAEQVTIAVIGGGLTSAQIADLAVRKGATKVVLICRSHLKIKHFDFDLEWVTKYANLAKMAFWREGCRMERRRTILEARDGGSVNPTYYKILRKHEKSGAMDILTQTSIVDAGYDEEGKKWTLQLETQPPKPKAGEEPKEPLRTSLTSIDYLVTSTGSTLNFSLPFLAPLLSTHPVELIEGLPRLTPELQWDPDLPCFVLGAYSMLELGPDALNLSGTRAGAERVTRRLTRMGILEVPEEVKVPGRYESVNARKRREEMADRSGGRVNFFQSLGEELE